VEPTVKILQIMPPGEWRALYAEHLETGELKLWTEPLIGWAFSRRDVP
jgi:hypothetical protein